MGQGAWLLFVALSIANASNYVFHVVVSRLLGPKAYGALGSVLAVMFIISVPSSAIQATVARKVAALRPTASRERAAEICASYFRSLLPAGLAMSAALLALSPVLDHFLHLGSWETSLFMGLFVLPSIVGPAVTGALQGTLRFGPLAITQVGGMAVRLIAGVAIVGAGGGVPGAVAASLLAQWVVVGLALSYLGGGQALRIRVPARTKALLGEVVPVVGGLAAMWLLIELDLILARHFLPPVEAGNFAAAGLLARAALFITGAVNLIVLPHFSQTRGRGEHAYRMLLSSSAIVVGVGLIAALGLTFGGHLAVSLTFGHRFGGAVHLLPILTLAMVGFAVTNLVVYFQIAARSHLFHALWIFATIEGILISTFHHSGEEIALVVLGSAWAAGLLGLVVSRAMALAKTPLDRLPTDVLVHLSDFQGSDVHPEISIVVPAYRPGPALVSTLSTAAQTLDQLHRAYELIVVADGAPLSKDFFATVPAQVSVVQYGRHQGKGMALRVGMRRARGRYVTFVDGDGDLDPRELKGFLTLMDAYDPDLVIGSKRHPLSKVSYPWTRRMMSWGYQRLVRVLFGLNVRDTQTGMKLIRRDVLDAVLPLMLEKRFAFDLEFLVVARRLGYRRIFEAPVILDYKFQSTVEPRAVRDILVDTAAIFYRRFILRSYDPVEDDRKEEAAILVADLATTETSAAGVQAAT
jgi:O-antigen/teichoic acid export membrane protein